MREDLSDYRVGMLDVSVVIWAGVGRNRMLGREIVSSLVSDYKYLKRRDLASRSFEGDSWYAFVNELFGALKQG